MNRHLKGATQLDDISGLKLAWVKNQDQLNEVEAQNIFSARKKHLKKRKDFHQNYISESYFQKVHFDMFCEVWNWAGKWRRRQTNIGIAPHQISLQLHQLCEDVHFWEEENCHLSILERAAILHHRLVLIHPFVNGNGRHARLITDIYLLNHKEKIPSWPDDLHLVKNHYRDQYLEVLKLADEGDYKPLLKFMKKLAK
ncbi:MAG: hypothetical protein K1000chlam3_01779 [Chlamydiae bacterium]|nr:hypothetical protein [Chlamydiota bacterium]